MGRSSRFELRVRTSVRESVARPMVDVDQDVVWEDVDLDEREVRPAERGAGWGPGNWVSYHINPVDYMYFILK